jgi:hypothetical protein
MFVPSQDNVVINEQVFEPTLGETFGAAVEQSRLAGTTNSLVKMWEYSQAAKDGEVLSPEKIREQVNIHVNNSMTLKHAKMIRDEQAEKVRRERLTDLGTKDSILGQTSYVAGTLLGALLDPIDFGVGALASFGAASIAKSTAMGALKYLGMDIAFNFGAAAVTETAYGEVAKIEGEEYDAAAAFRNVLIGATVFTSAFHGVSHVMGKIRRAGDKAVDKAHVATSIAAQENVSPVEVNIKLDEQIGKDLEIDEVVIQAVNDVVGVERAPEILGSVTDIKDFGNVLDEAEVVRLKQSLMENGFDERRANLIDGDEYKLSDGTQEELGKVLRDERNAMDYHPEAANVINEGSETFEIPTSEFGEGGEYSLMYEDLAVLKEKVGKEFADSVADADDQFKALQAIAKCLGVF